MLTQEIKNHKWLLVLLAAVILVSILYIYIDRHTRLANRFETLVGQKLSLTPTISTVVKNQNELKTVTKTTPVSNSAASSICGKVSYSPGAVGFTGGPISTPVEVRTLSGRVVAKTTSRNDGYFSLVVAPGTYNLVATEYQTKDKVTVSGSGCTEQSISINAP